MRTFGPLLEVRIDDQLTDRGPHCSNVFLGLAWEKQGRNDESERAYKTATSLKANDPLAWQGLISLYEQQGGRKLDDYHDAAIHLATLFAEMYVRLTIYVFLVHPLVANIAVL